SDLMQRGVSPVGLPRWHGDCMVPRWHGCCYVCALLIGVIGWLSQDAPGCVGQVGLCYLALCRVVPCYLSRMGSAGYTWSVQSVTYRCCMLTYMMDTYLYDYAYLLLTTTYLLCITLCIAVNTYTYRVVLLYAVLCSSIL